ncbi:MAG TPA: hypothetical protein VF949_10060 [Reyranella sp.]
MRAGRAALGLFEHMVPPTLYFFIAFNLIVFTTNLLVHDYWFRLSGFLVATTTALVVGKSVLVANEIRLIDRFRGAPLIQPILYKTIFYTLIVMIVRILERFIHFAIMTEVLRWPSARLSMSSRGGALPPSRSGSSPAS